MKTSGKQKNKTCSYRRSWSTFLTRGNKCRVEREAEEKVGNVSFNRSTGEEVSEITTFINFYYFCNVPLYG